MSRDNFTGAGQNAAAQADVVLNRADKAANAAASAVTGGVSKLAHTVVGEQGTQQAVALVSDINRRAEEAAQLAHDAGHDNFKRLRGCFLAITGIFARYSAVAFLCTITPFALAVALLLYTEQNKGLFGYTHTTWREALCSIAITACLLSWHAIFLRHQSVLMLVGGMLKYASIAIFVVGSYDMEAATTFCQDPSTPSCNVAMNPNAYDPRVAGNLFPAPYMDYCCVVIWYFAGGIISQRGEIIQAEIAAAAREAELLANLAAAGGAPVAVVEG